MNIKTIIKTHFAEINQINKHRVKYTISAPYPNYY